jgi:type I restriction enzyme, S subunit
MEIETTVKTINELCLKITDGSHFSPEHDENGKYPMYSVKDMEYNKFADHDYKLIGDEVFQKLSKSDCCPLKNDIVIAKDGSYLKYAFKIQEDLNACILSSIAILRPNSKVINPDYFVYLLRSKSIKNAMANYVSGSALPRIILSDFKKMKLKMISDLPTQQKIAGILSKYDEAIENNNKRIKLLEQMAQNLYKEWFVRFRFPGWQNAEFENGIPKGWKVARVGEYVKIKSGFAFKSEWWQEEGCPVVKIKDIDNGTLDTSELDCVSEEYAAKAKSFLLHEGDLVIAMTGATIGKIGLIPKINNLYTNQRVGKFFLGENPFEKMPIMYCLFSQFATVEMILCLSGASSAQPNISPEQLESIKFFYEERIVEKFNKETAPFFKMILKLRECNQNLSRQRDLLLPRLMSGKLQVLLDTQ